uniref:Atx10homo_assoc domain-containing protein n=1 Tax=Macrostomum lignano TaxID=282301 RepID=A0A1I8IZ61_9PLAT
AASSDSRRLAGQLEYRQQQRQPPPPPPDLDDYANLPPQQHRYEFSTSTSSRQVGGGGGGDVRLGSTSNISGPRSPQYVNGIVGGGAGGGVGYDYTVTVETTRQGSRPSAGSLHASQASGLDWAGRQQPVLVDQQNQYVNYRELRDESGGGGGGITLSRSDKFGMERSMTQQQSRQVEMVDGGAAAFRDPTMADLVAYLRSDNDKTVLNATAFIQHVTFADNFAKVEFFRLGGLPQLVVLLQAAVGGGRGQGFDLLRNLLGIVRNVTFRSNQDENINKKREQVSDQKLDELKFELCRLGVLKLLSEVIATSRDEESREIACAAVWNISSTSTLKPDVIETCAQTLIQTVLLPHAGLELRGRPTAHQPMHGTFLFYLASGVLRSVSSTPGEQWRDRLRRVDGLPDSLVWPLLSAQAAQLEVNQPGLENCLCAVRNLAFACQEVADPGYLRRQEEAKAAAADGATKKSPLACCGSGQSKDKQQPAGQKKPQQKQPAGGKGKAATEQAPIIQRRMPNPVHGMDRIWCPADMAPLLLHMLDACQRPHMFEAAAGTVQNLAACSWQPAVDFRKQFRAAKGHHLLCQLVAEAPPPLWSAVVTLATAYRNVLQDSVPKEVTAQQVQFLASILPPAQASSQAGGSKEKPLPPGARRPADQQAAIIAALFAALRREPGVVTEELFRCGAVASLVHISVNPAGNTETVVRYADALLAFLASSGEGATNRNRLRDEFGWSGPHKSSQQQLLRKQKPKSGAAAAPSGSVSASTTVQKKTVQEQHMHGSSASAGAGSGVNIAYDNAGFQPTTLELRATSSEPQYAQINRGERGYGYSATTTTKTTTVVQSQQEQEQQQVADSWV